MNKNRTTKDIYFLSASDRINYGDLLFPLISKELFCRRSESKFRNYGLIKSDLSSFGALKTASYKALQHDMSKQEGNLVLGGGEVFFPTWQRLYAYINAAYAGITRSYKVSQIEKKFNLARRLLSNGQIDLPFTPDMRNFGNGKSALFFNSVGGILRENDSRTYLHIIKSALGRARHISVRDSRTKDYLEKIGIKSTLVPDSALVMSDIYPIEVLESRVSIDLSSIPKKYAFVQFAIDKSPKCLESFARDLEALLKKLDIEAVLCPIGISANHEDQVALAKLKAYSEEFNMLRPTNLFDIMYLIARSEVYMGTSLHGMITAYSFGTRFTPLNTKVTKLQAYCESWTKPFCSGCTDFEDISNLYKLYTKWDFVAAKASLADQKKQIYRNYDEMVNKFI